VRGGGKRRRGVRRSEGRRREEGGGSRKRKLIGSTNFIITWSDRGRLLWMGPFEEKTLVQ